MGTSESNTGGNIAMDYSHSQGGEGGSRNTPDRFILQKLDMSAGLKDHNIITVPCTCLPEQDINTLTSALRSN